MPVYRLKPLSVLAIYFNGSNYQEVAEFCGADHADNINGTLTMRIGGTVEIEISDETYVVKKRTGGFTLYTKEKFESEFESV